jgi:Arc/MetJ-type ribon-helix-helix transcriptional regulator
VSERAISVRLDDDADDALRELVAAGLTQSQAIRQALVEAAERRRDRSLAAEAARLAANQDDRREAAEVRAFMDELRASW